MRKLKFQMFILTLAMLGMLTIPAKTSAAITDLNGQTGKSQTFQNDENIGISSANDVHTITWQGYLPVSRGGTGVGSLAAGSILFSNGTTVSEDNTNLFWDNVNNWLGIGTSSPTTTLDVLGVARVTSLISDADVTIHSINVGLGGGSVPTNTSVGYYALQNATSGGYSNTAVGYRALANAGDSGDSTAVGYYALASSTYIDSCAAFGSNALMHNTTGSYNTAIGGGAMYYNEIGEANTALGNLALGYSNTSNNIGIGFRAGVWQTDGSYLTSPIGSIYIGRETRGNNNDYNSIVIGTSAYGAGPNTAVIGAAGLQEAYFGSAAGLANLHATTLYLGSSALPGCIVMGDSDGSGVTYITVNDGALTVSATKPVGLCE